MEAARGDLESVGCQETRPWRLHRKRRTEPREDLSVQGWWEEPSGRAEQQELPTHPCLAQLSPRGPSALPHLPAGQ